MKIVVVSDSHGDISAIQRVMEKERDADYFFHAGDYLRDMRLAGGGNVSFFAVRGNCDGFDMAEEMEECFTLEGICFLLTHGHWYGVKSELNRLAGHAAKLGASVCVFGHTHRPLIENVCGVLMVNGGSVSPRKSWYAPASYAILETDGEGDLIRAQIRLVEE